MDICELTDKEAGCGSYGKFAVCRPFYSERPAAVWDWVKSALDWSRRERIDVSSWGGTPCDLKCGYIYLERVVMRYSLSVLFPKLMFWVSWIIYPYCFIQCVHAFNSPVSMFFYISFRIGKPSLWGLEAIWSMWMGRQEDKLIFSLSAFPSMLGVVVLSTLSN